MSATLADFPIGTAFWFLQRPAVVIEHHHAISDYTRNQLVMLYSDDVGRIRRLTISGPAFDYLLGEILTQREGAYSPPIHLP